MTGATQILHASDRGGAPFAGALVSGGRSPEISDVADVYGWLVGSWEMRVVDRDDAETKRERIGEWHFARVLEGRAIQDVFIVPARKDRTESSERSGNRYGCSLRVYDEKTGAWKVRWNNPVTGAENNLTGRRVGADIVQEGVDLDGNKFRWIFNDIKPDSFYWYGERSYDGGLTWKLEVQFFGKRMSS